MSQCAGPSMLPSVLSGDILFVNKAALRIWKSDLQIGDVVVCSSPDSGGKVVAKRVCGVVRAARPCGTRAIPCVPPLHVMHAPFARVLTGKPGCARFGLEVAHRP